MIERPKVFISYSHLDAEFVSRLHQDLEGRGADVWMDVKNIDVGDSITKSVEQALSTANYVCLVLSKNSSQRSWVQREYRTALSLQLDNEGKNPRILPILIDRVEVPLLLKDIRYADFRSNYRTALSELCAALKIQVEVAPFIDLLDIFNTRDDTYEAQFIEALEQQLIVAVLGPMWRKIVEGAHQLKMELNEYRPNQLVVIESNTATTFIRSEDARVGLLKLPSITMSEILYHGLPANYSFKYRVIMNGVRELLHHLTLSRNMLIARRIYLVPEAVSWMAARVEMYGRANPTSEDSVNFTGLLESLTRF